PVSARTVSLTDILLISPFGRPKAGPRRRFAFADDELPRVSPRFGRVNHVDTRPLIHRNRLLKVLCQLADEVLFVLIRKRAHAVAALFRSMGVEKTVDALEIPAYAQVEG